MALDDVLSEIKTVLQTVEGLRNLPDEPPAQLNAFPAALVYPTSGRMRFVSAYGENGGAVVWKYHTITVDLYVVQGAFSSATIKKLRPFTHLVPDALMVAYNTDKLAGTVATLGDPDAAGGIWPIRHEGINSPTPGGLPAYGWRYEIDVAFMEELTA